ncbi:Ref family recombination enhancement nuclease, partial [Escherichia coli]|uniref:Ref family recombination enhancement nuclease n=3 Tax=Enterobacteriaceae TaxID=543 RepID=UPI002025067D
SLSPTMTTEVAVNAVPINFNINNELTLLAWFFASLALKPLREKYPWLVPVHADGVVGGKKEFTLLNKSEMELLADAYEMANIMH